MLDRHLPPALRDLQVTELVPELLREWLAGLKPTRKGGGERDGVMAQGRLDKLRGLLGTALRQAKVPDAVIREGLSAEAMPRQRHTPSTRDVVPTREEVDALIAAMQEIDPALALFMEALAQTGARPSQLARCQLHDLDARGGWLTVPHSLKGRGGIHKTGQGATLPITKPLAVRLAAGADRATGLLFHKAERVQDFSLVRPERVSSGAMGDIWIETGRRVAWNNDWARQMREAVQAAGLDPEITLYTLRHARIVNLIQADVLSVREIAASLDTSIQMLEQRYSKHIAGTSTTKDRLRQVLDAEASAATKPGKPVLRVVS